MTVNLRDLSEARSRLETVQVVESKGETGFYRSGAKRILDIVAVVVTAPISLTIIFFFAALIALDGHNPFYTQRRVGRNGRVFRIFKLRSMVPNAEDLLERHLAADPELRDEWETTQKLKKDPRITRLGSFIRRASIDELPQLLNVLIGDMSLVGPRPMMTSQVSLYPGSAYYRLRPGITGPWQVSDRNECSFAERAAYDTSYDNRLSLRTDLEILTATVGVVMRCTGY